MQKIGFLKTTRSYYTLKICKEILIRYKYKRYIYKSLTIKKFVSYHRIHYSNNTSKILIIILGIFCTG